MENESLALSLREALAAGRTKLMHYYDMAKKSMHARLATSTSFSSCVLESVSFKLSVSSWFTGKLVCQSRYR